LNYIDGDRKGEGRREQERGRLRAFSFLPRELIADPYSSKDIGKKKKVQTKAPKRESSLRDPSAKKSQPDGSKLATLAAGSRVKKDGVKLLKKVKNSKKTKGQRKRGGGKSNYREKKTQTHLEESDQKRVRKIAKRKRGPEHQQGGHTAKEGSGRKKTRIG